MAKFSVSGARPHGCVLVEPARQLIEEYGILVGHTLVDASSGSGSVLIVNPNTEVVVLPSLTFIGKLVGVPTITTYVDMASKTSIHDGPDHSDCIAPPPPEVRNASSNHIGCTPCYGRKGQDDRIRDTGLYAQILGIR